MEDIINIGTSNFKDFFDKHNNFFFFKRECPFCKEKKRLKKVLDQIIFINTGKNTITSICEDCWYETGFSTIDENMEIK